MSAILQFLEGRFLGLFRIAASIVALSSLAGLFLRTTALLSLATASKWLGITQAPSWFIEAHAWLVSRSLVVDRTAMVIMMIGFCLAFKYPRGASLMWFGVGVCSELRDALSIWFLLVPVILLAVSGIADFVRARASDEYFESASPNLLRQIGELLYAAFYLVVAPLRWLGTSHQ